MATQAGADPHSSPAAVLDQASATRVRQNEDAQDAEAAITKAERLGIHHRAQRVTERAGRQC
ncbi:MAG: hypothetical protein AAF566_11185, partial [Pseudomonadota bacterium]